MARLRRETNRPDIDAAERAFTISERWRVVFALTVGALIGIGLILLVVAISWAVAPSVSP